MGDLMQPAENGLPSTAAQAAHKATLPDAAVIEIIERTNNPDPGVIVPNEIRINGKPVLAPADRPVVVHEVSIDAADIVQVTLTLFAKRVTMTHEPREDADLASRRQRDHESEDSEGARDE